MLLSFALCITASVAWFTLNRKTDSDGMGMALAIDDTSAIYKAYMYDLATGQGTDTDPNGEKLNVTNIDLNQYDTIFRAQNIYTPAFAQIQLIKSKSMPDSGTVLITIERNTAISDGNGALNLFSTSVVRFTALIDSTKEDLNKKTPKDLYNHINTTDRFEVVEGYVGNDMPNSQTFVTVVQSQDGESHTHEKRNSITLSIPYKATDWYPGENGTTLNVYLYITYDVSLIECFMNEQAGDGVSLDDTLYFFENDMKKISVSYTK